MQAQSLAIARCGVALRVQSGGRLTNYSRVQAFSRSLQSKRQKSFTWISRSLQHPLVAKFEPWPCRFVNVARRSVDRTGKIVPLKPEGEGLQHHQTYGNLCKSALEGWGLCILLKNAPLDWAGTHANKLYKWRKRASSASGVGRLPDLIRTS